MSTDSRTAQSAPTKSAASWDLRHPGLHHEGANGEEIHEFMGMWPLKPDADLVGLTRCAEPRAPLSGEGLEERSRRRRRCSG